MRKLFLSFTALLRELSEGKITEEDLQQGFFMFACTREHALEPGASGEADERAWGKGAYALGYPRLRAALLAAEKDARACWVRVGVSGSVRSRDAFELLNEMLERNSLPKLDTGVGQGGAFREGYHLGAAEAILRLGYPLEAVY